jgi:ADP-ribosylglycohydrolase
MNTTSDQDRLHDRIRGSLLAGACGDALGAPVEFMSRAAILQRFGPEGITSFAPAYGRIGAITDDTQMTLFTAEGILRAHVRMESRGICHYESVVAHAYARWLLTQGGASSPMLRRERADGWLFQVSELHALRAPGRTCLSALSAMETPGPARNDSKGCGGVMRVAPIGLFACAGDADPDRTFEIADNVAALTHGHPTGHLAAGFFAVLVQKLASGEALEPAIDCDRERAAARSGSGRPRGRDRADRRRLDRRGGACDLDLLRARGNRSARRDRARGQPRRRFGFDRVDHGEPRRRAAGRGRDSGGMARGARAQGRHRGAREGSGGVSAVGSRGRHAPR